MTSSKICLVDASPAQVISSACFSVFSTTWATVELLISAFKSFAAAKTLSSTSSSSSLNSVTLAPLIEEVSSPPGFWNTIVFETHANSSTSQSKPPISLNKFFKSNSEYARWYGSWLKTGKFSNAWSISFSMFILFPSPLCAESTKNNLPPGFKTLDISLTTFFCASGGNSWNKYTHVTASNEPSFRALISSALASKSVNFPPF
mmetsp:Transcript_2897/g.8891  ORF Transcript_2897/g.8891 Transcript_2897/m.8891 type:complete len:204 (-) Transcript_2897:792-1403(-)